MSRSRARKNRFKYKTLRRIGFFKVFVMNYPNSNGNMYPSLNFGISKNSKKFIRELQNPQGSFFSISSHVDEGYNSVWDEKPHEPLLQKMIEGIIGTDKLTIAQMLDIEEPLDKHFAKLDQPVKEIEPCPWLVKMDMSGVWSNPADVSKLQGPSFEQVKTEKLVQLAKALKKSNAREYLKKTADILGEDIEVDDIFLGDGLKMFRVREDMWNMDEVKEDSPEWVVVMIAFCRHPELARRLRAHGSTSTEVRRSALNDSSPAVISDVYHLFDTTNIKVTDAFKPIPFSVQHEEHIGEAIIGFTAKMLDTTRSDWTLPDDK